MGTYIYTHTYPTEIHIDTHTNRHIIFKSLKTKHKNPEERYTNGFYIIPMKREFGGPARDILSE